MKVDHKGTQENPWLQHPPYAPSTIILHTLSGAPYSQKSRRALPGGFGISQECDKYERVMPGDDAKRQDRQDP